jgi:hypothetical protein
MKQSSSFKSAGPKRKAKFIQLHKQAILTDIVRCKVVKAMVLKPALYTSISFY